MPLSRYLSRRAAGRGQGRVPSAPARPGLLARADRAFHAWWHARTRPDRRAAWTELRRAGSELRAELAASSGPAWLLDQLQARITDRTCAALTQQLQEETVVVDRRWLDAQIADAVAHGDIDELERLAEYAHEHDDKGTARDIHGTLIKPHREKWTG